MNGQLNPSHLEALEKQFSGQLITPDTPGYNEARSIYNSMIDRRPCVIAQCADVDDVVSAIRFGRDQGLEIAVRGGGHSVAGKSLVDDGLVIDMQAINSVTVNADAGTVKVGGGATMSQLDRGTQPFNLMTTGGRVSTTGVGGFILGGGSGWLERKYGFACDNLVAVDLVTADGNLVHASDDENPELFWGLHGGGGNFGVATSFTLRTHSLPVVTAALLLWPPAAAPDILSAYRDFMEQAPEEIGGGSLFLTGPAEDFVPRALVGRLAYAVLLVYAGNQSEAREVIAPMLALGHQGEMIADMPYADFQCMLDDPPGYRNYWSAEHLNAFPDQAVARFCARARDMVVPSPSQHIILPLGGAVVTGGDEYPLPWRHAPWVVHPFGLWENPADDEQAIQWAHDIRTDLKPWATESVYLNFIGDEGEERIITSFGQENYDRLARLKARYDPENVFHHNQNIQPAS